MKDLVEWIVGNSGWLYGRVHENRVFFLDWWSFAHLWSGGMAYALLLRRGVRSPWLVLAAGLFAYEVGEILIRYLALDIFQPETLKDQFTDLWVGMLGGVIVHHALRHARRNHRPGATPPFTLETQVAILCALTIAFLWVGNYGYQYNVGLFNTRGLNYYLVLSWGAGMFLVIRFYVALLRRRNPWYLALAGTWVVYLVALFAVEYLTYHVLEVREISKPGRTALLFDTIHGTSALHWFYLTIPSTAVGCFTFMHRFFAGIELPEPRWRAAAAVELRPIIKGILKRSPLTPDP